MNRKFSSVVFIPLSLLAPLLLWPSLGRCEDEPPTTELIPTAPLGGEQVPLNAVPPPPAAEADNGPMVSPVPPIPEATPAPTTEAPKARAESAPPKADARPSPKSAAKSPKSEPATENAEPPAPPVVAEP